LAAALRAGLAGAAFAALLAGAGFAVLFAAGLAGGFAAAFAGLRGVFFAAALVAGRTVAVAVRFVALAAGIERVERGAVSLSTDVCLLAATDDLSPRVRANEFLDASDWRRECAG
jgi:hypothetical protein